MTHSYRRFDKGQVARPTEYLPRVEEEISQTLVMPKIKRRRRNTSRVWYVVWYLVIVLGVVMIVIGL